MDMSAVADKSVDAIFSSHNIEHVYPHEVGHVLNEFLRVLSDDGFVVLTCPDLQAVCEVVAADKLLEPIYELPIGPISPLDVLYGHRPAIAAGNYYMAHKCGFTFSVLTKLFLSSGFKERLWRSPAAFFRSLDFGIQTNKTDAEMKLIAQEHLPQWH